MNQRNEELASLAERKFDLVVIGAGLLGANVALEAVCHGFSVLVVDKGDFASGSSSRTSKLSAGEALITGSPFRLAAGEASTTRISNLFQRAPHMVKDFAFVMPITNGAFLASVKAQVALALQDLRSGSLGGPLGHKRIGRSEALKAGPSLAPEILAGGLSFHDCIADDSRFVVEMIKAAKARGTLAFNYVEAIDFELHNAEVKAVVLRDRLAGREYTVQARVVVSACGVWTEQVTKLLDPHGDQSTSLTNIKMVRSTHIILSNSALEVGSALLLPARGGRYVYVVPWQRTLLVGSTAEVFEGSPDEPLPTADEIEFLLETINSYNRGGKGVSRSDLACAWAGLNIVPDADEALPQFFRGPAGVLTGYGGHLGDVQKMADLAVHLITKKIGAGQNSAAFSATPSSATLSATSSAATPSDATLSDATLSVSTSSVSTSSVATSSVATSSVATSSVSTSSVATPSAATPSAATPSAAKSSAATPSAAALSVDLKAGTKPMLGGFADREDYIAASGEIAARARSLNIEPAGLDHLFSTYGKDALYVLDLIEKNAAMGEKICPDFPPLMAEVVHCVENEMAISLEDVLCRRIRLGFLHREQCLAAAPKVGKMMQDLLNWDNPRLRSELSALARNLASQLAPVS